MASVVEEKSRARLSRLDYVFNPRSIAFVGATENPTKWGFIVLNNLLMGGYDGALYPVNPGRESILGLHCYESISAIPGEIDLAVFTIPAGQVPASMDECVKKGVKAALVISAGFKELGIEGEELEREMVRKAQDGDILLIGPNCQGISCPKCMLFPWMPLLYPAPGPVAVVSQSGNILNMIVGELHHFSFGISKAVSSGNEADTRIEDYLTYLADDPDTQVIIAYIEGLRDGREFFERARELTRRKPIVVVKGGRTDSGVAAAKSHTGAMAVSSDIFEAACRQAGLVRAQTIEEAACLAAAFVNRPLPRGKRLGIITGGGGLGVMASDASTEEGLEIVPLSDETLAQIGKHLPGWWVPGNPVDLVAGLDLSIIPPIVKTMMLSGEVDAVIFIFLTPKQTEGLQPPRVERGLDLREAWQAVYSKIAEKFDELFEPMTTQGVPLYVVSTFQEQQETDTSEKEERKLAIFDTVEMGCRAISAMAAYRERTARAPRQGDT